MYYFIIKAIFALYKMLHVSTLKGHQQAQIYKKEVTKLTRISIPIKQINLQERDSFLGMTIQGIRLLYLFFILS